MNFQLENFFEESSDILATEENFGGPASIVQALTINPIIMLELDKARFFVSKRFFIMLNLLYSRMASQSRSIAPKRKYAKIQVRDCRKRTCFAILDFFFIAF